MTKSQRSSLKNGSVQLDKAFLRAAPEPSSFNEKERTIDVVVSTGSRGRRMGWFTDYYEELAIDKKSIRMDRLNSGAPVLTDHRSHTVDAVIGVVENARIEDGNLVATVRFTKSEAFADVVSRIQEGIIRKVSVGYLVHSYEELDEQENELPIFRAVDWEPVEVSFVAVPFDNEAQARSGNVERSTCKILNRKGEEMSKKKRSVEEQNPAVEGAQVENQEPEQETPPAAEVTPPAAAPESETPAVEGAETEKPAAEQAASLEKPEDVRIAEQKRSLEILTMCRNAKLGEKVAEELIKSGVTLEVAQRDILARWAKGGSDVNTDTRNAVTVGKEPRDGMRRGMTEALLHRFDPSKHKLSDEAKQFRGLSLVEMAKDMMSECGHSSRGMSKSDVAAKALSRQFWSRLGMQTTDDFPAILADVANKTLRAAYEQAPQTFRPFVRFTTAPDFKNINRVQLGEAPALELVGEHGEFKYGAVGDSKETYKVRRYGKIVAVTREVLVNDDLDAIARLPQLFGRAGANLESDLVYAILTGNPVMGDTVQLFHSASHANVGTTGAISATTLGEARMLGRKQTGVDGETLLNIMHKFLIVPAAKETIAQQQVALVIPNQSSSVNPFQNLYSIIVEPRLDANSGTAWYMAADPGQIDTIEVAYLEGQEGGVRIESEIDFDTDGMKLKAAHDVGVKAIDWRGFFKNAGA